MFFFAKCANRRKPALLGAFLLLLCWLAPVVRASLVSFRFRINCILLQTCCQAAARCTYLTCFLYFFLDARAHASSTSVGCLCRRFFLLQFLLCVHAPHAPTAAILLLLLFHLPFSWSQRNSRAAGSNKTPREVLNGCSVADLGSYLHPPSLGRF